VVTVLLIIANAAVFLYEVKLGPMLREFLDAFGFVPARFLQWHDPLSPYRFLPIFTAMFLHGGWAHILGNMLYLWVFGDNVEDRLGHGRFLVFYLMCGTAAFLVHSFFSPEAELPAIGASGAIAGVLGAYLVLFPRSRVMTLIPIFFIPWFVEIPAVVYLGFWFILQLFNGTLELSTEAGQMGGVAWWAHAGGFVTGIVLSFVFRKSDRQPTYVDLYRR
jgi:membrane associated rhomboid family serine protease